MNLAAWRVHSLAASPAPARSRTSACEHRRSRRYGRHVTSKRVRSWRRSPAGPRPSWLCRGATWARRSLISTISGTACASSWRTRAYRSATTPPKDRSVGPSSDRRTSPDASPAHVAEPVRTLSARFQELALELDVPYCDLHAGLAHLQTWEAAIQRGDGVHPDAPGYELIQRVVENWSGWQAWWAG
ncbi:MAG: lipolytic protein family [Myxococcaceae bacterium]|nr:lipolytic protein family [Myxococcaceae bacterium]